MISRRIAQYFGGGSARVRLDPGNGNVMIGTDLLKKSTDVLRTLLRRAMMELSPRRRTLYSLSVIKLRRRRTG